MKKIFLAFALLSAQLILAQGNTLFTVDYIKVQPSMRTSYESAWKTHVNKFHNSNDKREVYEILTGPSRGAYLIMEGPYSFADMDKPKPSAAEHDADLEKNLSLPVVTRNTSIFRYVDSLSYHPTHQPAKAVVTLTHVKNGKMNDYMNESKKGMSILSKMPSSFSNIVMTELFSGSDPIYLSIRSLKDGFKELEDGYAGGISGFKDAYIKDFGQEGWDNRMKILNDYINSREVYLVIERKDLSSK